MVAAVLDSLARATEAAPGWAKAWHNWALYNVSAMEHYAHNDVQAAQRHVAPAVLGFFRSVALAQAQGKRCPMVMLTCRGAVSPGVWPTICHKTQLPLHEQSSCLPAQHMI